MAIENSQPPKGGPMILPSESNDDSNPVVPPCPVVDFFVSNEDTLGRINPLPIPKMVRNNAAVPNPSVRRIKPKPAADMMIPSWMTIPSPSFLVNLPTNPPCTMAPASPMIMKIYPNSTDPSPAFSAAK